MPSFRTIADAKLALRGKNDLNLLRVLAGTGVDWHVPDQGEQAQQERMAAQLAEPFERVRAARDRITATQARLEREREAVRVIRERGVSA